MIKNHKVGSESFKRKFTDQKYRYYFQLEILCAFLSLLSLCMGVVNTVAHSTVLAAVAFGFSVLCLADLAVLRISGRATALSYAVIDCAVICLLIYFLVTGGANGTGAYWIPLLPVCGMIILGKQRGFILSALVLAVSIFLLWTPVGASLLSFDYSPEFRIRFPIIYTTFFLTGILLNYVKYTAFSAMQKISMELKESAEKDALTGMKNRFWFNKSFYSEYGNKLSEGGSLAVLMDIDDFKNINDTYGHPAGDVVLKGVSDIIRGCLKDCRNICRWGGEEFFVFISECDMPSAADICERIRREIENTAYSYGSVQIRATVSVGAVYIEKDGIINIEKVLYEADRQMYLSKTRGKNRVSFIINEAVEGKVQ